MRVIEACSKPPVVAHGRTSVHEAARLMRDRDVGCVVVTEKRAAIVRPVGIVTDRDLVIRVMATGEQAASMTLDDILAGDVVAVNAEDDLFDALKRMRASGVRRMPVLDTHGSLVGLLSIDDVLAQAALMLAHLPEVEAGLRRRRIK